MKLADQCILPARPETVWRALNDPAVLEACLPGCKSLAMLDERHFESTVQIRVGPVAATFKSNVELSDLDPPRAYTIVGTGNAGAVGFAKVTARVQLELEAETTVLMYDADVEIGGKLMSVGSRLIQSAAGKNLDAFFGALKAHIEKEAAPADSMQVIEPAPHAQPDDAPLTGGVQRQPHGETKPSIVTPKPDPTTGLRVWLVGAGSGLLGLLVGFLIGHAA
ncbi:carbon monoxide dehydrogenase subunit G [Paraburkholderia madseniana]|uniref:Carbon monoxide dehydrogenase subunit G n=1 Tax=Paraburkholderia madseniana TaxID=2599607 RepID=A0AAP5B9Z6_9BURK|nr:MULTISPECIES: carbon monoxide dehydrogenase subunit G [Paraburkholderia]MCX4145858.1 carbon monoxide dehydrogenase subunit G [Paraburkholderia madseniana]MDN7148806.1 carbon monoxide dehydrogenase subunit G [Paraburkholderia sp. WS6]MDQ6407686.1 carbon monoxide dehydrogenase subunit G [Paraburkholderia madseniana]